MPRVGAKSLEPFSARPALANRHNQMEYFLMKSSPPYIPVGLTPASSTWWKTLIDDYDITDAAGLLLLENAMRARDRMEQASELIAEHGAVTVDRYGQLRPNPATTIERDSRAAMQSALKALNLDMEPLRDSVGRPTGR